MSINILQKPGDIQPAQSPIVFSVITSGSNAYTASQFQYTANLYIWDGLPQNSGSFIYTAVKFPNASGSGIFDFSRLINSQIQDLSAENPSNIKYYKVEFGYQYQTGSIFVSSSVLTQATCSISGTLFKAYDGYAVFPDDINSTLYDIDSCYPFMTDMCTVTQSIQLTDTSLLGSGSYRAIPIWRGLTDAPYVSTVQVTASYANGATNLSSFAITEIANVTTSRQVYNSKGAPGDAWSSLPTSSGGYPLESYVVKAVSGSTVMSSLPYKIVNECYYTPIRVAYKNKYGQFDWFNFYKRHDLTFNTDQRLYQPQLGTWGASTLTYSKFQTRMQRYIVDATEVLACNTDYLEEGYNELFKQLLVSDEIYWVIDDQGNVRPLTVQTNSLQFKTHVNVKLIQYTIVFDIGQPFKFII
jgi:hypothetical protein